MKMKLCVRVLSLICLVVLTGCSTYQPITSEDVTTEFVAEDKVFVTSKYPVPSEVLNRWLSMHPNMKVVLLSSTFEHSDGTRDYALYVEPGENSRQIFTQINYDARESLRGEDKVHAWFVDHLNVHIVSLLEIVGLGNGKNAYILCYEL
jgi:hypothetical protein